MPLLGPSCTFSRGTYSSLGCIKPSLTNLLQRITCITYWTRNTMTFKARVVLLVRLHISNEWSDAGMLRRSIQNLEWNLLRSQLDTRNKVQKVLPNYVGCVVSTTKQMLPYSMHFPSFPPARTLCPHENWGTWPQKCIVCLLIAL